ncbi:MAG: glutathione binding-like protein [Pseudomonadota bacterium]
MRPGKDEPPLFGTSPAETGEILRKALDFDLYVSSRLVFDLILPLLTGADDKDALRKTASWAHDEIARLEADIGERAWLVGDQLSAADLAIYPILEPTIRFTITPEPLEMGLGFDAFAERYPRLQAWRSRVQALPGYEDAYPAAWRRMDEAS